MDTTPYLTMDFSTTDHHHHHDPTAAPAESIVTSDKWRAFGITVFAGFATFIGAFIVFCVNKSNLKRNIPAFLLFSAGVIIHLAFLHLVPHTVDNFQFVMGADDHDHHHGHHRRLLQSNLDDEEIEALAHVYTVLCICGGIAILIALQRLAQLFQIGPMHSHGHCHGDMSPVGGGTDTRYGAVADTELVDTTGPHTSTKPADNDLSDLNLLGGEGDGAQDVNLKQLSYNISIALILHHFPQGIATYVALVYEFEFGVLVALASALHVIPCGISISSTIFCATKSYVQPFVLCLIAALAYPIGAVFGFMIVEQNEDSELVNAILFGLISGVMIYIVLVQIIPSAITQMNKLKDHSITKRSFMAIFAGLLFMEISVILLALTDFHAH